MKTYKPISYVEAVQLWAKESRKIRFRYIDIEDLPGHGPVWYPLHSALSVTVFQKPNIEFAIEYDDDRDTRKWEGDKVETLTDRNGEILFHGVRLPGFFEDGMIVDVIEVKT